MIADRLTDMGIGLVFGLLLAAFIQGVWYRMPTEDTPAENDAKIRKLIATLRADFPGGAT
jgi:hypothetical protein